MPDTRILRQGDSLALIRPVPVGIAPETWSAVVTITATGADAVVLADPVGITPADAPASGYVVRLALAPAVTAGWPPGRYAILVRYTTLDGATSVADEPAYLRLLGRAGASGSLPGVYPEQLAALESALVAEVAARAVADTALAARCLALETALPLLDASVAALAQSLTAEAQIRAAADTALGARLTPVESAVGEHAVALTALGARLTALEGAVAGLGGPPPAATTDRQGVVELATLAETLAGTDGTRAVTPVQLATTLTNRAVLLTGDQTIAGQKTFSEVLTLTGGNAGGLPALQFLGTGADYGLIMYNAGRSTTLTAGNLYLADGAASVALSATGLTTPGSFLLAAAGDFTVNGPGQARMEKAYNYMGGEGSINYIGHGGSGSPSFNYFYGRNWFNGEAFFFNYVDFSGSTVVGLSGGGAFDPNGYLVSIGTNVGSTTYVEIGNAAGNVSIYGGTVFSNGTVSFYGTVNLPNQGAAPTDIAGIVAILRAVNLCT